MHGYCMRGEAYDVGISAYLIALIYHKLRETLVPWLYQEESVEHSAYFETYYNDIP